MSNTSYDKEFSSIPFYNSHSYMLPFVGDNYISPKHKKLLLVGCNHYMPEKSSIHHNTEKWYKITKLSNSKEENFCNTRGACEQLSFYLGLVDSFLHNVCREEPKSIQDVAFYNFFLRPADYEGNIKDLWFSKNDNKIDVEEAKKMLPKVIKICKPDIVVFLSALVWKYAKSIITKEKDMGNLNDFKFCNSPSRHAWNRRIFDSEKQKWMPAKESLRAWLLEKWLVK